jgi:hypothetical protein
MTQAAQNAIHEDRTDSRLYCVTRDSRTVKRSWRQMSDAERAAQLEAEARAAYNDLFNIY